MNGSLSPRADIRRCQDIAERLAALETETDARSIALVEGGKLTEVDSAVKTMDEALNRLSARIAETENTANTAIRTLEETVSSLGARRANRRRGQRPVRRAAVGPTLRDVTESRSAHVTRATENG